MDTKGTSVECTVAHGFINLTIHDLDNEYHVRVCRYPFKKKKKSLYLDLWTWMDNNKKE